MIERALLLLQQSRYDLAEQELRQFLAARPEQAHGHAMLAVCLGHQNKLDEAEQSARRAIELAPDEPYCHYALGWVKIQLGDLKDARQAVDEAIRLNPEESSYYGLLALIFLQAQRWQEALDAANEGLAHNPAHQGCLNHRAAALVKLNRHDEAQQTIDQALRDNPENALTHTNLGWAHLHKGEHLKALEHFSEALRLDPDFEFARHGLVEALKAKYFVYRWLLRFFLWMSTMSPRMRGGLIIGAFLVVRVLRVAAENNPSLVPFVLPIVSVYALFVLLTWVVDPAFNLLLRLNKYGRHALSKRQRLGSSIFGFLLAGTIAAVVCGAATGLTPFYVLGLNLGLLIIPAPRIVASHDGKANLRTIALVAGMIVAGALATVLSILGREEPAMALTAVSFFGVVLFTWLGGVLRLRGQEV